LTPLAAQSLTSWSDRQAHDLSALEAERVDPALVPRVQQATEKGLAYTGAAGPGDGNRSGIEKGIQHVWLACRHESTSWHSRMWPGAGKVIGPQEPITPSLPSLQPWYHRAQSYEQARTDVKPGILEAVRQARFSINLTPNRSPPEAPPPVKESYLSPGYWSPTPTQKKEEKHWLLFLQPVSTERVSLLPARHCFS
jgi:hypothetical protein